jgi:hypothetical protein
MLEKEDFKSYMPLHFPYSKNAGKKNLYNRFDETMREDEFGHPIKDPKNNTTTRFDSLKKDRFQKHQLDNLHADIKGYEVAFQAEERLGRKLEEQR